MSIRLSVIDACPCCGSEIDITMPVYRGILINARSSLSARIVLVGDLIQRTQGTARHALKMELEELESDLRSLPEVAHG